ncbi:MAG: hypothetical protein AB1405_09150, partial [Bdellovibrionota bacterium]
PGGSGPATGVGPGGTGAVNVPTNLKGVRGGPGGTMGLGILDALSAEEIADLASEAFLGNQQQMAAQPGSKAALVDSAKVLTRTMARLSPEARFALLRRLAGSDEATSAAVSAGPAVGNLSQTLPDNLIADALCGALSSPENDPETVEAIGNLLRRLKPIESERQKLLEQVDKNLQQQGRKVDGVIWQEIQSRSLKKNGLGMLELGYRENLDRLIEYAQARIQQKDGPPVVMQALAGLQLNVRTGRTAKLLQEILAEERSVNPALLAAARELLDSIEDSSADPSGVVSQFLGGLLRQAQGMDPSAPLPQMLKQMLSGQKGAQRTLWLAKTGTAKGLLLAEAILEALEMPLSTDLKRELLATLATVDAETFKALRTKLPDASPMRVYYIVQMAVRSNPLTGIPMLKLALRNRNLKAKEACLRAAGEYAHRDTVALLGSVAGAMGDEEAKKLVYVEEGSTGDEALRQLQRVAIEILGQMRSPLAVPALDSLLNRPGGFGSRNADAVRPVVAKALAVNATADAKRVLAAGKQSKNRAVREACEKVA